MDRALYWVFGGDVAVCYSEEVVRGTGTCGRNASGNLCNKVRVLCSGKSVANVPFIASNCSMMSSGRSPCLIASFWCCWLDDNHVRPLDEHVIALRVEAKQRMMDDVACLEM
jgi:hypothetical protein